MQRRRKRRCCFSPEGNLLILILSTSI
jgi:hypothetical protein